MRHSYKLVPAAQSLFVAVLVAMTIIACSRTRDPGAGDTSAPPGASLAATAGSDPCAVSSESIRRVSRQDFVTWARGLRYDDPVDRLGRPHGSGTNGIRVHVTGGIAAGDGSPLADGCLIARIYSASADPSLGLGPGWTYVWADSSNPYTATMIPEDSTVAVTTSEMSLYPTEPTAGTVSSPKYICSDCGRDWCVYPRDTTRLAPEVFQSPGGAGMRDPLDGRAVTVSSADLEH